MCFWKSDRVFRFFPLWGLYRRRGSVRGGPGAPHHQGVQASPRPRRPMVWLPSGSAPCGDPGLPIRNTRYAYNSRSHDQCVVNSHIRVDNRITSPFAVPNNILTIGHMTKHDIAMQGKSTTKQRIPSSVDDPRHAYYPTGN
jgi:hypothetical protein